MSIKRMQQTARLVFKRKAIAFMRWDESSNGLHRLARCLITPQVMGRSVRKPNGHLGRVGW